MILSILLFEDEFIHIVAISFTALICNELLMVALEINTWHKLMILAEIITILIYFGSMWLLPTYFGKKGKKNECILFKLINYIRHDIHINRTFRLEGSSNNCSKQLSFIHCKNN